MERKQRRSIKLRRLFLNVGKLTLDATKLCFGSLVLGAAIRGSIPESTLLFIGIITSTSMAAIGLALITIFEEK